MNGDLILLLIGHLLGCSLLLGFLDLCCNLKFLSTVLLFLDLKCLLALSQLLLRRADKITASCLVLILSALFALLALFSHALDTLSLLLYLALTLLFKSHPCHLLLLLVAHAALELLPLALCLGFFLLGELDVAFESVNSMPQLLHVLLTRLYVLLLLEHHGAVEF